MKKWAGNLWIYLHDEQNEETENVNYENKSANKKQKRKQLWLLPWRWVQQASWVILAGSITKKKAKNNDDDWYCHSKKKQKIPV